MVYEERMDVASQASDDPDGGLFKITLRSPFLGEHFFGQNTNSISDNRGVVVEERYNG